MKEVLRGVSNQILITKQISLLLSFWVLISGAYFTVSPNEKVLIFLSRDVVTTSYIYGIVTLIVTFCLEIVWYLVGEKLSVFKIIIGFALNIIKLITKTVFYWAYVFPLKLMLTPVLTEVLRKNKTGLDEWERFIFTNQKIGLRDDDHRFLRTLNTKDLKIKVRPTGTYPRWRLGLKFSEDGLFCPGRYDNNHILFHLTKDQGQRNLQYHLYKDGNLSTNEVLIDEYINQLIIIDVSTDSQKTSINIMDNAMKNLKKIEFNSQVSTQLFAWADGESNFEIEVLLSETGNQ